MNPTREELKAVLRARIGARVSLRHGQTYTVINSVSHLRDMLREKAEGREKLRQFTEAGGGRLIDLRDAGSL